jgi:hypothetical protein
MVKVGGGDWRAGDWLAFILAIIGVILFALGLGLGMNIPAMVFGGIFFVAGLFVAGYTNSNPYY